jgi:teichoic acid ribitol-phosphate primase
VNRLEYRLAAACLRVLGALFSLLPMRRHRVVLASPRTRRLDGNLLHLSRAISRMRPDVDLVHLLEPYSYGLRGKLAYALRVARGMYLLRTSRLFVVDNAYLPVHVAAHPPRTDVVQVWHAVGALKRFGVDTIVPLHEPERTFLHRHYDWVVTTGEATREPWSRALRTPVERVLPLGTPRTDFFFDVAAREEARAAVLRAHPELANRRVITYAPTFRGRGAQKRPGTALDAARLRAALPETDVLLLKSHPNLDPTLVATAGFDVVAEPDAEMNDILAATEILVTDYSSSVFEFALLRRPMIVMIGDLEAYEQDPGLYLDVRADLVGTKVVDTDGVIEAIRGGRFDLGGYDAFIERYLEGADGLASQRFVERFVPA